MEGSYGSLLKMPASLSCAFWLRCISLISPLTNHDPSNMDSLRIPIQLARRDSRVGFQLPPFNPASGVDGKSQTWGLCCHSTTRRKGLSPSSNISYQGSEPCLSSSNQGRFRENVSHSSSLCQRSKSEGKSLLVQNRETV